MNTNTNVKQSITMKNIIITIAASIALCFSFNANAQEVALPKGSNVINAGVGITTGMSDMAVPPVFVQYERIVAEFGKNWGVGVGGFGGFFATRYSSTTYFGGGACALGDIHYSPIRPLDLYAGLYVGYIFATSSGISAGKTDVGGLIGARYFFTDTFGLNLQIGGMGTVNLGVSFRF